MTLIRRAGPWDEFFALRRTMERLSNNDARPLAWRATFAGAEPLVGAGTGR